MKEYGDRLLLTLAPPLAAGLVRLLKLCVRTEVIGANVPESFWSRGENVIIAFWHDQLLLMVGGYRGPGAKLLISASKDGELLARTMKYFGQGAIRGSSSRGGYGALRRMVAAAGEKFDLALTPDGPKGPRHEMKAGVVQLARLTGRPVVPMAFACSRGHRFASWDRFLLPYPFCRGVFSFGDAVTIRKEEDLEISRRRLQAAMEENEQRARARVEEYGVSAV